MTVGAVDDHPAILHGLEAAFAGVQDGLRFQASAPSVAALLRTGDRFDVVLLDLHLADGSDAGDNVHVLVHGGVSVLLYSVADDVGVVRSALARGAMGVVSKSEPLQAVVHAVRTVAAGEPFLSSEEAAAIDGRRASLRPQLSTRELQALTLFAGGMPIKSVARRMDVSQDTVKAYLVRARKKYFDLNRPAGTKLELYKRAVEDGFLRPPRVG